MAKLPGNALKIEITTGLDCQVIHLTGELTFAECMELRKRLLPVLGRRPALAIFDLKGLTFLSSLGMGVLLEFRSAIRRTGGQVRLDNVPPVIHETLGAAGVAEVFGLAELAHPSLARTST